MEQETMKSSAFRYFVLFLWALLPLYAVKPSVVFLTYVISGCIINCDVSSVSLYKIFGSTAMCVVLTLICVLLIVAVLGFAILVARKRLWCAVGVFLLILLLPFQFSELHFPVNLCFGGKDMVSFCEVDIAGREILPKQNNRIVAVKQKDSGYPPYAIFNGFDIDGVSRSKVGDDYVVEGWLTKDARSRLSRILERHASVGYLIIEHGRMHYVDGVERGIQKEGMYFVLYCGKSEEAASDAMDMTDLTPMPDLNEFMCSCAVRETEGFGDVVYRGRVMDLEKYIKMVGIRQ